MATVEKSEAQRAFEHHLMQAEQHAKDALDMCYADGVKRSLWYRMTLGRAQSILMSLLVRELGKEGVKRDRGNNRRVGSG